MDAMWADLPDELRLSDWQGPTLFTSEVQDGDPVALAQFEPALAGHARARSLVIGSVREPEPRGDTPTIYGLFVLGPDTGEVNLVELDGAGTTRFVNRGIAQLIASFAAVTEVWPQYLAAAEREDEDDDDEPDGEVEAIVAALRDRLSAIDARALSDDDTFWSVVIDDQFGD